VTPEPIPTAPPRAPSRVTHNILYNLLGQGAVLVLSFIAVRFIFRRLGADAYGLISFNVLLTALVTTAAELGISSTTVREVSAFSHTEPDYVRDLIRTASLLYWGLWLAFAVAIFAAAPLLVSNWVQLTTLTPAAAVEPLRVLSIAALTALPRTLYVSLFRGRQRMEFNNAIDVATSLVQQGGVVAIIVARGSFLVVAAWIAASMVASVLAYLVIAGRMFGWRTLIPGYSVEVVRRNLRFSGHMMSISILSLVQTQTDKVLVSRLLPISSLGLYSFISTLGTRATFVTTAVAQAALPSLSRLHQAGAGEELKGQYRRLQDLVCFGTLPVFAGIVFFSRPLFGYLFSDSIAVTLLLPTAFLSLGFFMNATITIPYTVSLAVGRPEIAVRLNLVALLVVTPVTAALVYAFGIPGAAFSWVFYHLFAYVYTVPRWCAECLEIPTLGWFTHLSRPFLLGAVTYGVAYLVAAWLGLDTALPLAVLFALASLAYLPAAYAVLGAESRASVRHRLLILRRLAAGAG
jgi:O-antigen/teichoic acid export membrane protein